MKNKYRLLYLMTALSILISTSCQKQSPDTNTNTDTQLAAAASDDIEADVAFNDVYNNVSGVNEDIAIAETDIGADTEPANPLSAHCYTITIMPLTPGVFPKTVTIDFGAGCLCKGGKTRKGKIITVFTNRLKVPAAKATTTFDGYYVNDVHVEGTHIIQNNSSSAVTIITRTVTEGKLTRSNNNSILWNATFSNTQTAGLGTPNYHWDDEFSITGNASGQNNRSGKVNSWSREINEPLQKKVNCKWFDKGTATITYNSHSALLDFGDGSCNNLATITYNGITKQITLP